MNSRNLLLIVALAVAGLGGAYWWLMQIPQPIQKAAVSQGKPEPTRQQQQQTPLQPVAKVGSEPDWHLAKTPATEPVKVVEPLYESQIDQVLRSNIGETQSAKILINILPTMPEEGQVQAAQHIANLLPDADYQSVLPTLLNPNTPESVTSVLFTDLMNRSDATKLNAFLDIAKVPTHPNQEEAMSDLQIFLDHDYGTDWPKWKAAVVEYLAKQTNQ